MIECWGMRFSYDDLRALKNKPRLHHNGFVQLDLPNRVRLHVWPEHPPKRPNVLGMIHDHVYGFDSEILRGSIQNLIYEFDHDSNGEYQL